jgi:hypothetical protein
MEMPAMPPWIRIWMMTLLVSLAVPLNAQEWIYCPAAPEELERQCGQAATTIRDNLERMSAVGEQIRDPNIILAKVDRRPDESVILYKLRVQQQQGVATPGSNRWLPVLGRYFDPDRQIMYVALNRQDYWQYVWEALSPDEDFARRTFSSRERVSQQFKQTRFSGPGGELAQWQQEVENAQRFRQQCCATRTATDAAMTPTRPGEQIRP